MRIALATVILCLCVSLRAASAPAQTPPDAPPAALTAAPTAASPQADPAALLDRIKRLAEELQLSPDQKTQLDAIFQKAKDDLQSAKEDLQNASQDEKASRFRDLLGGLRQQVGELLSDDQKLELQQKLQTLHNATTTPSDTASPNPPAATPGGTPTARRGAFGQGSGGIFGGGFGGGTARQPGSNGGSNFAGAGNSRGGQLLQRLKSSLDQLGLSADQQSQVDVLFKDLRQRIEAIHQSVVGGSIDRSAAREKTRSLFQTSRTKLGSILTPDQLEKLRLLMPQGQGAGARRPEGTGFGNTRPDAPEPAAPRPQPATAPSTPAIIAVQAPAAGQPAPDFSLKTLNGNTAQLSSYNHKLLVLVLGSYTNPPFRDKAPGLESLREQYGTRGVNFLIVYTREMHPTGGWEVERNKTDDIKITQPASEADRKSTADRARAALKLTIDTAPDTMDDKTATAYAVGDGVPAYVIGRNGQILFHQSWLEPMALGSAIEDALK